MFKLDDNDETIIKNWPVVISVPQDGGATQKQEITADFRLLPQDQIDEQLVLSRDAEENADMEILRRVIVRVGGVADTAGQNIDYTTDLLERLMKKTYIRAALVSTYFDAAAGNKARRKN